MTEDEVKRGVKDAIGLIEVDVARAELRHIGLPLNEVVDVDENEVVKGNDSVNVLVV
ncbi:hypothetical protein L917_08119, partial [Phytophthora nicotianae]